LVEKLNKKCDFRESLNFAASVISWWLAGRVFQIAGSIRRKARIAEVATNPRYVPLCAALKKASATVNYSLHVKLAF